jgi:hypothetical protein
MQRPRVNFANVVSCLALFVALGGTGYAAINLPRNSVGAKQIRPGSIDNSKVKKGSLRKSAFRAGQLPRGRKGATGAPGVAGPKGDKGDSFSLATILAPGQTEHGDYGVYGAGGGLVGGVVDFRIPLAQPIGDVHAHFIVAQQFTPQCPGFEQAAAGELCVYQTNATNTVFADIFGTTGTSLSGTSTVGFQIYFTAPGAAGADSFGEWAVTAP